MADSGALSLDDLIEAIEASEVLQEDQKVLLVHLLPRLNDEQKAKISAFLEEEKKQLQAVHDQYEAERAPLYKDYLNQLNFAFKKAEKLVAEETEKQVTVNEQKGLDDLINSL